MDRLFVDGREVHLDPNKTIGYTVHGINLSDITTQKTSYSNRIRIPLTDYNREVLGYPEAIGTGDRSAYKLLPCSLWIQGFQVVSNGLLKINEIGETIEATVFSGDLEAFKLMRGLKLKDLDIAANNHYWNMAQIAARSTYATATSGLPFYPAINYKNNPVSANRWNYNYLFPAWYLYDLIAQAFTDQGYKIGDINFFLPGFQLGYFARLIVPFSNKKFQNGAAYTTAHTFNAISNADTVVDIDYENTTGLLETPQYIDIVAAQVEDTNNPNYSSPNFTEPNAARIRFYGEFEVSAFTHTFIDTPPADPPITFYKIALVKNGTTVVSETQIGVDNSLSLDTYAIEEEIELATGDTLALAFVTDIESDGANDEVTVDVTLTNVRFSSVNVQSEIFPGGYIEVAEQLPDIKQDELIRYAAGLIGAYVVTDPVRKEWTFKPFVDIAANKAKATNWDSKLVIKPGQSNWYISKKTAINGFYQRNLFEWLEDDTVNPSLGEGEFSLDNKQLDKSGTPLGPLFAASEQRLTNGVAGSKSLVYIDKWDDEGKPNDIKPRLCLLGNLDFSFSIQLTDADTGGAAGPTNSYYPAKFSDPGVNYGGLSWERDVRARYWTELIAALNDYVEIEVYFNLDASDLSEIISQYQGATAPIIPIYLRGSYWLINQVKSFRRDEFSRVTLIKI